MNKLDALIELERRGQLPQQYRASYDEAKSRGIINDGLPPANIPEGETVHTQSRGFSTPEDNKNYNIDQAAATAAAKIEDVRFLQPFGQGVSFGSMDEVVGAMSGVAGPNNFSDDYEIGKRAVRMSLEKERSENPIRSVIGEIAGGLTTAALPVGAAANFLNKGGTAVRSAKAGTVATGQGSLYGYNSGDDDDRVANAVRTGAVSGLIGGAGPVVGKMFNRAKDWIANRKLQNEFIKNQPSVESFANRADKLYKSGKATGTPANATQTNKLANDFEKILTDRGLISPTGRVNSANPKIKSAYEHVGDFAGSEMTPAQMLSARLPLDAAMKSIEPSERAAGLLLRKELNKLTNGLNPKFKQADKLTTRRKSAELVDTALELANSRASGFSNSGVENAIRTEFRSLDRAQIKGKLPNLSEDEVDIIQKIVRGGKMENLARNVGKLAPTGPLSATLSSSVPYMLGQSVGGPAVGAAAAAGTMSTGIVAKKLAEKMQLRNAQLVKATAMAGGKVPKIKSSDKKSLVEYLLRNSVPVPSSIINNSQNRSN